MIPFYTRFPALAARETRCIHQIEPGGPLPVGQYGFVECFCDEENCDCRRVTIQVTTPQAPTTPLAVISYGWESPEFYGQWMKGDLAAARDCAECILDPLSPQSQYADHLLDVFRAVVKGDPAYVARLARHYEMFKRAPGHQASAKASGPRPGMLREIPLTPKIPRNDLCPCGSGKKFKHCCGR